LGQKVNPIGFRLGIIRSWNSRWFARKDYARFIIDDHKIREFLKKKLYHAGISNIEIERWANRIRLRIYAARPGIVIGKRVQIERRVAFRRAMKRSVASAMRFGAKGIKISSSGRLGGAEMARTEWYKEGRIPLHTLRADIDYGFAQARCTYGIIGIKVWIFGGEILEKDKEEAI
jgi:small subunit ribosomal protein S3